MNAILAKLLGLPEIECARPGLFASQNPSKWASIKTYLNLRTIFDISTPTENFQRGPLVIVANHPHGLLDGVCIADFIQNHLKRDDFVFLTNSIIAKVFPELKKYFLSVDNMSINAKERAKFNDQSLKIATTHLESGGILVVLPAGRVSEWRFISPEGLFTVSDPNWRRGFVKILENRDWPILPLHISGKNSNYFQVVSLLGQTAKRIISFREFLSSKNRLIKVRLGQPQFYAPNFDIFQLRRSVYQLAELQ